MPSDAHLLCSMDPSLRALGCPMRLLSLGKPRILQPKRGLMEIWPTLPRYIFVQRWFQLEHASFPDRPIILQDDPSSPARSQSPGSTMLRQRTQLEVFNSLSGDRRADLCGFLSTASCSHASSETVLLPAAPGNTA